jgi:NADPH-dependent 2,4-dienoyl-CoA reductase/sulfur reductase-like enzyme
MKICIIGGVAGGASAATRLRRLDESAEIVLFEKGEHISYANCGMPYYLGREIKSLETLIVTKPERLIDRFHIDVRMRSEVVKIDRQAHKLTVQDPCKWETVRGEL